MWMLVVLTISLQAGQVCLACEHCHPGYCSTSDNRCSYCIDGYYLRNGRCTHQCPKNCKTCTSTCDTCNTGYYGDDCLSACSEGCKNRICAKDGGECTSGCAVGYYGNPCSKCSVGCVGQTCDVLDGRCTDGCIIGYYGDRCQPKCSVGCIDQKCAVTDRQCTYGCIAGYYGDLCDWKCSTGCLNQECDKTSGECKHGCVEGYYDVWCRSNCSDECVNQACDQTTGQCKNGCADGYYGNGCRSKCSEQCLNQKCDVTVGRCSTGCIDGYYGGRCELKCSDECVNKACEQASGNCTKIGCIDGLYLSGTYCLRCPDRCTACTSISNCTSCKTGFFGSRCDQPCRNCKNNRCSIDGRCIDGCTDIHYQGTTGCDLCPSRCMACTSSTSCTSCSLGYYGSKCDQPCNCKNNRCSFDGQCTLGCNDRHYQGHAGCDPCPSNCLTCTSSTSCTSCSRGFFGNKCNQPCRHCKYNSCSIDGQCTHECLDKHYPGHAGCDLCPNNCLTCTSSTSCTSCSRGFYGNKCNQPCRNCKYNRCNIYGQCTHGCIDRHYPGHAGCNPCPANCIRCKSSSQCDECRPGYHGTTCEKRCPSHCTTCENDSYCLNCKTGYYGPSCEKNCSTACIDSCSKEDGECECLGGYYKGGTVCKVCSRGCVKCHSKDVCSECQDGYFLEPNTQLCSVCGKHCSKCLSEDKCSKCDGDHANINGSCTSCHNCMDVAACSSRHVCSQCFDGFWGQFCGNKCNDTCIRCDKATGHCTECKDNTFGLYCEQRCSSHCLLSPDINVTCWKHNGTCTRGCIQGFTGLNCTKEISPQTSVNILVIVGSISGVVVVMVTVLIVGIIALRRHANRPDLKTRGGHPAGVRDPRAVSETLNPAYADIDIDPAAEPGHQTAPAGICVASADHVYAVVQKKPNRKPGQLDKTRGQNDGTDTVYDVASTGRSQGGATNTNCTFKSRSQAEEDTYSHINHTSGLRQHCRDNEGTYDQVTRQNIQKGDVDNTYDVTVGQTSRVTYDHTVKPAVNTAIDEYSTVRNVQ